MKFKKCNRCEEIKSISNFYVNLNMRDGHSNMCKQCSTAKQKQLNASKEKKLLFKENNLKRNYDLTQEEYNKILLEQGNKCIICGKDQSESQKAFAVDHNHITGRVRGILCSWCNTGIGLFKDDPKTLYRAIQYLYKNDTEKIAVEEETFKN